VSRDEFARALQPFWNSETEELDSLIVDLTARGWLIGDTHNRWTATPLGASIRSEAATRVRAIRERVVEGITPREYAETIAVLARMAANLSSNAAH
jgi:hypothetical protein